MVDARDPAGCLYTVDCPLADHPRVGAPECDIGWHRTKDNCKCALRNHLCGPSHDIDPEQALRVATNAVWAFQIDPLVFVEREGSRGSRSRSPRRELDERNMQMFAAARDSARELATLGRRVNEVFDQRADEFDELHTTAATSLRT
jgi:hypothetical protein